MVINTIAVQLILIRKCPPRSIRTTLLICSTDLCHTADTPAHRIHTEGDAATPVLHTSAAFALFLLAVRAPSQIYRFARLLGALLVLHELVRQHLLGDHVEHLVHVQVVLGRRLEQLDFHLAGETLRVLGDDHLALRIVVFVAHCVRKVEISSIWLCMAMLIQRHT